jgi:tRNA pseudouridine13 synthase
VAAPAAGARFKEQCEDFVVEEIPSYEPSGEGTFHYLWVEKRDISGGKLVQLIAQRLGLPQGEIGMAGNKDRRAVTRQWVSVPATPGVDPAAVDGPFGETGYLRVLAASRHTNKLKTGHNQGNRFTIRVRGLSAADAAAAAGRLETIAARGFANAFGPQRFSGGDTVRTGLDALRGRRIRDKRLLRLAISAVQSAVFNHWLGARAADGLMETALAGDVLKKTDSGGVFVCEDAAADTARLLAGELTLAGPLPGRKMRAALGEAGAREAGLMEALGLAPGAFDAVGKLALGTRRAAVVWPTEASAASNDDGLLLRFALPSGSYASVLCDLTCGPEASP